MVKSLKIIFPAFLASVIIASCFYSVSFFTERSHVRQEVKEKLEKGLSEEKLVRLVFSEREFAALTFSEKNEFYFDHEIYDIVRIVESKGKIIILALDDKAEKELFKDLDEVVSSMLGNAKSGNSPLKSLGKIVSLKYLATEDPALQPALVLYLHYNYNTAQAGVLQGGFFSAPFNPPELV